MCPVERQRPEPKLTSIFVLNDRNLKQDLKRIACATTQLNTRLRFSAHEGVVSLAFHPVRTHNGASLGSAAPRLLLLYATSIATYTVT